MSIKMLYKKEIDRIRNRIVDKYGPEKIILFGSCANGKIRRDSDADMLIVKNSRLPGFRRTQKVYKLVSDLGYKIPLDIIVYTPSEFKKRLQIGDAFIKEIYEQGKMLYAKN